MADINYTVTYDIDAALEAQGSSIEALKAGLNGCVGFLKFAKTLDGEVKDKVLAVAAEEGSEVVLGFKELQALLNEFLDD